MISLLACECAFGCVHFSDAEFGSALGAIGSPRCIIDWDKWSFYYYNKTYLFFKGMFFFKEKRKQGRSRPLDSPIQFQVFMFLDG